MKKFNISKESRQGNIVYYFIEFEVPTVTGADHRRMRVQFDMSSHTVTFENLIGDTAQTAFTMPASVIPLLKIVLQDAV